MAKSDRKYERGCLNILVNIYEPDSTLSVGRGFIRDVSLGGMGIETGAEFKEGNILSLDFTAPNGMRFKNIEGTIVRIKKDVMVYNMGIRFTRIKILDKLKIWWYVKRSS